MIEAGPEVSNFDQIEIGDQVKIEYYESVALYLGNSEDKPEGSKAQVMMTAPKGDKPGSTFLTPWSRSYRSIKKTEGLS